MNILFIADTHFGHKNILRYRPQFKTLEEHDNFIIERWNKKVRPRDIVWVLGDMYFKCDWPYFWGINCRLNGYIKLVSGNHDDLGHHLLANMCTGLVKKYGYWLSHAPIHPQELRGLKNIHGHVHHNTLKDDRYFNVSCENIDYTPISLDEIRWQFSTREWLEDL